MRLSQRISKKDSAILVAILTLILIALSYLVHEISRPGESIPFETVRKYSGIGNWEEDYVPANLVIRNETSWAVFWSEFFNGDCCPRPPVPENISWDHQMIMVADYGISSDTGLNHISFTSVRKDGINLYAYIKWTNGTGVALMMPSHPYHFIIVERAPEVVFVQDLGTEYELNWWAVLALVVLTIAPIVLYFRAFRTKPKATDQSHTKEGGR